MPLLPLDRLEIGMVLDADVHDRNDRLLLPKGESINDRRLRQFKIWGVVEAFVLKPAPEGIETTGAAGSAPPEMDEAHLLVLKERYSHCDMDHPVIRTLFEISTLRSSRG
ncbi:MAG: hypothetical protein HQL53_04305 [Magnetococcales bacterium]|nr:hypothetical protein [Magnetococcales bacterium]